MVSIKSIVERQDSIMGKLFDWFIQSLIVLSLVSFSIETLPGLDSGTRVLLKSTEVACVVIFTLEYLTRLAIADRKLKFIFSFYGLIDLLAILPFYLTRTIDLRAVRVFRLFRLFRAFKLFRYSKAIDRLARAFSSIKEELVLFFIATLFLIYVSAVGIYYFENPAQPEHFKSVFHSMWWAVVTLTSVGYGDIYPVTGYGKSVIRIGSEANEVFGTPIAPFA